MVGEEFSVEYDPTPQFAELSPRSRHCRYHLFAQAAGVVLQDSLIFRAARLEHGYDTIVSERSALLSSAESIGVARARHRHGHGLGHLPWNPRIVSGPEKRSDRAFVFAALDLVQVVLPQARAEGILAHEISTAVERGIQVRLALEATNHSGGSDAAAKQYDLLPVRVGTH